MASDQTLKILVVGSVRGHYSKLFKRVHDVNLKAGPFDLLLCIGDFFGEDTDTYNELVNGDTELPNVHTYILGPITSQFRKLHPNVDNFDHGFEIVDGITFLGRSGILNTSQGLRIGYLNGQFLQECTEEDKSLEYFTKEDYDSLLMSQRSSSAVVDILITAQWPRDVFKYTTMGESMGTKADATASVLISKLCWLIRPRYHFAGGFNFFYERPPFRNHRVLNEAAKNVTRFYSVADITNTEKMKWIYAFNIVPAKQLSAPELVRQPEGVTENPFGKLVQEQTDQENLSLMGRPQSGQFFFAIDSTDQQGDDGYNKRGRDNRNNHQDKHPRKQLKVDQDSCWFCLASANVDKSLIVSIGDLSYLALAKGGLTDDHMMILPIGHIRSSIEIEEHDLRSEITHFKTVLLEFFKAREMVPVFFERNFRSAHFQIHVIGLPESKAPSLKATVATVFDRHEYHELSMHSELFDVLSPGAPYFFLECPGHYKFFVRINTKKEFFPIQIGRDLLAHPDLLNCPDKVDWKKCTSSPEEVKQLTHEIRKNFEPFDFTRG